jgi:2-hydroxychromene-2-carboxylate isomerase
VWAEGLDAGSDKGLRQITSRAGLAWPAVCAALQDDAWRLTAEANRVEMLNLGLWGVPSFKVGDTTVWGQDRMEALELTLRETAST